MTDGGIWDSLNGFFGNNQAALLAAGTQLLDGGEGAWGRAGQGFVQGMQQDRIKQQMRRAEQEAERRRSATARLASEMKLSPDLADMPDVVGSLFLDRHKRRDPQLIGSAETGYAWLRPGDPLPENMAKPQGAKPTDDLREYALAKSQGYQGTFLDYQKELKRAGATSVNVGGGSDQQIFGELQKSAETARSAASGLGAIQTARQAVQEGAILGAGADMRLELQKVGASLGVADPSKIVSTETFRAAIAPQVAALMKATVGSTQISNADREFAEKAAGGAITLEPGTINRLLDIMERANETVLDHHEQRLNAVYPDGSTFGRERALFGVQRPAKRAQSQQGGVPLEAARAAIAKGADRAKVIERLRQNGIDPSGL